MKATAICGKSPAVLLGVPLLVLTAQFVRAEELVDATSGAPWTAFINADAGANVEGAAGSGHRDQGKYIVAAKSRVVQTKSRHSKKTSTKGKSEQPPAGLENSTPRGNRIETGSIDSVKAEAGPATPQPVAAIAGPSDAAGLALKFCVNFKPQAEELRIVFQKKQLSAIQLEVEKRLGQLDAKIKGLKEWLERRQEFTSKAQDTLVKIYAKMRPDAAAVQLASIDSETAAAVLLKLEPRVSSAILNDMEPKLAAQLASTIASAGRAEENPPNQAAGKP